MTRTIILVAVIAMSACVTTRPTRPSTPPPTIDAQAERQFEAAAATYQADGATAEVLRDLEDLVRSQPGYARAWFNLGVVAEELGERQKASRAYTTASELDATFAAPLVNLGMMAIEDGDRDAARSFMARAAAIDKHSVEAHRNQSAFLRERGDLAGAVEQARLALQANASDPNAFVDLARAHYRGKAYAPAMLAARTALELDPKHAEAQNLIGVLYWAQGEVTEAIAAFDEAVRNAPTDRASRMNLGAAFLHVRDYDRAAEQFDAVLASAPLDADARVNLAVARRSQGDLDAAQRLYNEVLAVDPNNATAHFNLAVLEHEHLAVAASLESEHGPEQALDHYDRALAHYRQAGALGADVSQRIALVEQLKAATREQL